MIANKIFKWYNPLCNLFKGEHKMNIWHDIDEKRIKADDFIACIEIPKGSKMKYEMDKETGMLILDRILHTSMQYPANYGFIPKTLSDDGDPLDVLVLSSESIAPGTLVRCYPIGVIAMIDNGDYDEKVIAIPFKDPFYNEYKDVSQLPKHIALEMQHFLKVYKDLEDKVTEVREMRNAESAREAVEVSIDKYHKKFDK